MSAQGISRINRGLGIVVDSEQKLGTEAFAPKEKGSFGMYLEGNWYELSLKSGMLPENPVEALDVSMLQDRLLSFLGTWDYRQAITITLGWT